MATKPSDYRYVAPVPFTWGTSRKAKFLRWLLGQRFKLLFLLGLCFFGSLALFF